MRVPASDTRSLTAAAGGGHPACAAHRPAADPHRRVFVACTLRARRRDPSTRAAHPGIWRRSRRIFATLRASFSADATSSRGRAGAANAACSVPVSRAACRLPAVRPLGVSAPARSLSVAGAPRRPLLVPAHFACFAPPPSRQPWARRCASSSRRFTQRRTADARCSPVCSRRRVSHRA